MLLDNSQMTFAELEDAILSLDPLMVDKLAKLVDWQQINRHLETMYVKEYGRPAIPPLIMFKILLLEMWFDLSDVKASEDIHDRASFKRFLGGGVRRYKIDSSSIVRFRERLRANNMDETLKALVNNQIKAKGCMMHNATVKEAVLSTVAPMPESATNDSTRIAPDITAAQRTEQDIIIDSTMVKAATMPGNKKKDGTPVDPDVKATQRNKRPVDGMKVHIGIDAKTGFIEEVQLTEITVHDHEVFAEIIPANAGAVYADKAYGSAEHREWLRARNIADRLLYKGYREHPITPEQTALNRLWSSMRAGIERKIADLKHRCSLKRLRYFGRRRNWTQVLFAVMACNLKRLVTIA